VLPIRSSNSNLAGVTLFGADLTEAKFINADLSNVRRDGAAARQRCASRCHPLA
jgi:uncharacterized protein YjbI with pentapeptide repeats